MNNPTPGLLVVDLQPAYAHGENFSHITPRLMQQVLAHIRALPEDAPVAVLHVNEELSGDTVESVQDFWREHGADEDLIARIHWSEKSYAFLRGWMDNGVDHDDIVSTLREMRQRAVWDSRSFEPERLHELCETGSELCDPLFRDEGVEQLLKDLRSRAWNTCGGGRDECLQEVELVLRSADITYERLDRLTY